MKDGIAVEYRPLYDWLMTCGSTPQTVLLADLESTLGHPLPKNAWRDTSWWRSTPRNSWARSWLRADRRADLNPEAATVTFVSEVYAPALEVEGMAQMHQMEARYARSQLAHAPDLYHVGLRWWEPHYVYILRLQDEPLFKVGHTRHDSRRLRELTARGRATVESKLLLGNVWAARVVEGEVLQLTVEARQFADKFTAHNGQTEHWHQRLAAPNLEEIAQRLAEDSGLPAWNISRWGNPEADTK